MFNFRFSNTFNDDLLLQCRNKKEIIMADDNNENLGTEEIHELGGISGTELGWEKEADAVIQDVRNHVKLIRVAENLKVSYSSGRN